MDKKKSIATILRQKKTMFKIEIIKRHRNTELEINKGARERSNEHQSMSFNWQQIEQRSKRIVRLSKPMFVCFFVPVDCAIQLTIQYSAFSSREIGVEMNINGETISYTYRAEAITKLLCCKQ